MQSLRGIFPQPKRPPKRDFIKENVKNLKQLNQKKINERNDPDFNGAMRKSRSVHSQSATKPQKVVKTNESGKNQRPSSVQSRDASSQTEQIDNELFLKDTIIRLPSSIGFHTVDSANHNGIVSPLKQLESDKESVLNTYDVCKLTNNRLVGPETIGNNNNIVCESERYCRITETNKNQINTGTEPEHENHIDHKFDEINNSSRYQHGQESCKETKKTVLPISYRVGELPKYLIEMKEKQAEKCRLDALIDPNCPPGHTALSNLERLDALNMAQKKYQDLINELNRMPMTSRTLRIRNRQIEIEKELNKLDETIQIFSRLKVYVKN